MGLVLTHSAKYKPMSFERLIQPYVMATEEYRALEKGIADLDAEAATIKQLAMSEEEGSTTRTRYEQYAAELENKANELASKGLKGVNRKSLYDLQAQYKSQIQPIDNAAKMRAAEIAEQKEGMKDPTMRYSRIAAETSLDYYLDNPTPTYDKLSGASLAAQVNSMVAGIAKQMRDNPREWESVLGGQYWQTKHQLGFTDEEILLTAARDPNAPEVLRNIVNDVVQSSRYFDWEGATDANGNLTNYGRELENWAWKEASKGLWGAVGETSYAMQDNKQWDIDNDLLSYGKKLDMQAEREDEQLYLKAYYDALQSGNPDNIMLRHFIGGNGDAANNEEFLNLLNSIIETPDGDITTSTIQILDSEILVLQDQLNSLKEETKEYNKVKNKIDDKQAKINSEAAKLKSIYDKYSHFNTSNSVMPAYMLGIQLDYTQAKQQSYVATIKYSSPTERKAINDNLLSEVIAVPEDKTYKVGMYRVKGNGKKEKISDGEARNIFDETKNPGSGVSIYRDGNGIQIRFNTGGDGYYVFENFEHLNNIEKEISNVDKFLKDFTYSGVDKDEDLAIFDSDKLEVPELTPKDLKGTSYKYAIAFDLHTNNYIKYIIDPKTNRVLYSNSVLHEVVDSSQRDYIIGSLLTMALTSMLPREKN